MLAFCLNKFLTPLPGIVFVIANIFLFETILVTLFFILLALPLFYLLHICHCMQEPNPSGLVNFRLEIERTLHLRRRKPMLETVHQWQNMTHHRMMQTTTWS